MSTEKTICGFPKRFSSSEEKLDPILNKFLENVEVSFSSFEECRIQMTTKIDKQVIKLPSTFKCTGHCNQAVILDIQEILNMNGRSDLIVCMDHNYDRDIEICTKDEFLAKLKYPISEYRAEMRALDGIAICHPTVPYTWLWVTPQTGKIFPSGSPSKFDKNCVCYRSCYGFGMIEGFSEEDSPGIEDEQEDENAAPLVPKV